jgi:uncharacterized iron-regulated membrane protein
MSRIPTTRFVNKYSRKLHRWGAILIAIPAVIVFSTGILLQLKKHSAWIQPAESRGSAPNSLVISFDQVLEALRTVPEAQVQSWEDVDRLDVRCGRGMLKVRCNNNWEVQIDTTTAEVMQVAYRRSDIIESIHDGSYFHDQAKLWAFLPTGAILLALWLTGIYLWVLPFWAKRQGRKKREAKTT